MTDRVFVKNLCLHGHHGVLEEETRLGQRFFVDIECATDHQPSAQHDDYSKAVCYATLCDIAKEVSDSGPFKLIETLGQRIADRILDQFQTVARVNVRVRKPSAPIHAAFDHVGIEVDRFRRIEVAFSLGSNRGDKPNNIKKAIELLGSHPEVRVQAVSKFYRTSPWGETNQDWFVNACILAHTSLDPLGVLRFIKSLEIEIGRIPSTRWGPREIDIDLLFYGDQEISTPELTLPHSEMFNRAFVMIPLADIAPERSVSGRVIKEAATSISVQDGEISLFDDEAKQAV